jgi:hypothetical protein
LEPEVIRAIEQTAREQVQKLDEPENEEDDQSDLGKNIVVLSSEIDPGYRRQ